MMESKSRVVIRVRGQSQHSEGGGGRVCTVPLKTVALG